MSDLVCQNSTLLGPFVVRKVDAMPQPGLHAPAASRKLGVSAATLRHPHCAKSTGDRNMRAPVAKPVHVATSPMNACTRGLLPWHLLTSVHCCQDCCRGGPPRAAL